MIQILLLIIAVAIALGAVFIACVSVAMPVTDLYPRRRQRALVAWSILLFVFSGGLAARIMGLAT